MSGDFIFHSKSSDVFDDFLSFLGNKRPQFRQITLFRADNLHGQVAGETTRGCNVPCGQITRSRPNIVYLGYFNIINKPLTKMRSF